MRIANKLISDKVSEYTDRKEKMPVFDKRDAADIFDLELIAIAIVNGNEDVYTKLIQLALEQSKDDDNLHYFTIRYFEKASFETIATEMNLTIQQIYVLRKKLVRRLMNFKEQLTA
jgi:ABC-type Zn uptake system ZnuABC Zn-binding protein ZnuA